MPFDIRQALTRLSRTPGGKLYYAFCEKGAAGQPVIIAHTKPIVDADLEDEEKIPAAMRSKLAKGVMAMQESKLVLKPKGGKALGKDALQKGVTKAIELGKAKSLCENVSVGDDQEEEEVSEQPVPFAVPYEGKKHADPISANPKVVELLRHRQEFVSQREALDEDNPQDVPKVAQINDKLRQIDGVLAKLGVDAATAAPGKPLKTKELGANYKDEDKKFGWRADQLTTVSDGAKSRRPATAEDIEKAREKTHLTTRYDTEADKAKSHVEFDQGAARRTSGARLDDGEKGFVMDPATGKLHTFESDKVEQVAPDKKTITHHSTPLAGKAVAGAGHIKTSEGRIVSLDDASGHYKPDAEMTLQVVRELSAHGATLDTKMVDENGKPVKEEDYNAAVAELKRYAPAMLECEKQRKALSARLLKEKDLSEGERQKILTQIDQFAKKFEKLSDAVRAETDLIRGHGPANRPLKVELQGKEGLSKEEFATVQGNVGKINELLRKKLKLDYDLIDASEKKSTLESLPALNLLIGEKTKLELTSQQFEQTQGNEKQARQKAKVNAEIEELAPKKAEEERQRARVEIVKRLQAIGISDEREAKKNKAIEMGVLQAYCLTDDDLDLVVLGDMSVEDAIRITGS